MVLTGYVQTVHLDTDYYDTHFRAGAYLPTHREHWERWHAPANAVPPVPHQRREE